MLHYECEQGAIVIVDAFWGDAGKGRVSAWMAKLFGAKAVFGGGVGPNAEHGVFIKGQYVWTNQLPLGWLLQGCPIGIGPGVAVDPKKLLKEERLYNLQGKITVDPLSPLVTPRHIEQENNSDNMERIGSTKSGTGAARSDYHNRTTTLVRDTTDVPERMRGNVSETARQLALLGPIVIESSQGMGLSLQSQFYPFVTSEPVDPLATVSRVGLPWHLIKHVVLVVKALPSREGTGSMGDVEEYTVEEMEQLGIAEYSSITNPDGTRQIRRKAKGIDWNLLRQTAVIVGPTMIALTFVDHVESRVANAITWRDAWQYPRVRTLVSQVESATQAEVVLLNVGKDVIGGDLFRGDEQLTALSETIHARIRGYTGLR